MKQFLKQLIVLVCGVTLVFAAGVIFFSDKRQAENEGAGDQELLCLAKQGDATAQAFLESMYYEGDDVFQYYEQAFSWYPKAAEQGDASAQAGLGLMYYEGHGVPQDYQQAVSWFRKAAEQGEASAQMHLGLMYYEGHGVPQDYEKAFSLVRKAC